MIPPHEAIAMAVALALRSPCAKSCRGVAITKDGEVVGTGHNRPPGSRACAGDDECREACGKLCIHAEIDALRKVDQRINFGPLELVHIKVTDGVMVPSGGPSCWQCARDLLDDGRVAGVWLLHAYTGWHRYPILEFYELTMTDQKLPVLPRRRTIPDEGHND